MACEFSFAGCFPQRICPTLPICETGYEIVHNHQEPKDQLTQLFMRSTKSELA